MTISKDQLEADLKLCQEATEGPWHSGGGSIADWNFTTNSYTMEWLSSKRPPNGLADPQEIKDGNFITRSRSALPQYITEVQRLNEENLKLRGVAEKVLNWSANFSPVWYSKLNEEARAALEPKAEA